MGFSVGLGFKYLGFGWCSVVSVRVLFVSSISVSLCVKLFGLGLLSVMLLSECSYSGLLLFSMVNMLSVRVVSSRLVRSRRMEGS